jgi:hypothetical protein
MLSGRDGFASTRVLSPSSDASASERLIVAKAATAQPDHHHDGACAVVGGEGRCSSNTAQEGAGHQHSHRHSGGDCELDVRGEQTACLSPSRSGEPATPSNSSSSSTATTTTNNSKPAANSNLCPVCFRFPMSQTLGCGHGACRWCSTTMHGCGVCGEVVLKRTPYRAPLQTTTARGTLGRATSRGGDRGDRSRSSQPRASTTCISEGAKQLMKAVLCTTSRHRCRP